MSIIIFCESHLPYSHWWRSEWSAALEAAVTSALDNNRFRWFEVHAEADVRQALATLRTKRVRAPLAGVYVALCDDDEAQGGVDYLRSGAFVDEIRADAPNVTVCATSDLLGLLKPYWGLDDHHTLAPTRDSFAQAHQRAGVPSSFWYDEIEAHLTSERDGSEKKVLVLHGPTGCGKSMCLESVCAAHRIQLVCAKDEDDDDKDEDVLFGKGLAPAHLHPGGVVYWLDASGGVQAAIARLHKIVKYKKKKWTARATLVIEYDDDWRAFGARGLRNAVAGMSVHLVKCTRPNDVQVARFMEARFPLGDGGHAELVRRKRLVEACCGDMRRCVRELQRPLELLATDATCRIDDSSPFALVRSLAHRDGELIRTLTKDSTTRLEDALRAHDTQLLERLVHENMLDWAGVHYDAAKSRERRTIDYYANSGAVLGELVEAYNALGDSHHVEHADAEHDTALWTNLVQSTALASGALRAPHQHTPVLDLPRTAIRFCHAAFDAASAQRANERDWNTLNSMRWLEAQHEMGADVLLTRTGTRDDADSLLAIPGRSSTSSFGDQWRELRLWRDKELIGSKRREHQALAGRIRELTTLADGGAKRKRAVADSTAKGNAKKKIPLLSHSKPID